MSAFQSQLAAGISQAMSQTGVVVTYTPTNGDPPFQVMVVIDNRGFLIDGENALVLTSALNRTPESGDQITLVTGNGKILTLTTTQPDGMRNCWEWQDRYQIRFRIHLKVSKVA